MSDQDDNTVDTEKAEAAELASLKARAKQMNLTHSNNIGLDALRKRVSDALEGKAVEPEPEAVNALTGKKDVAESTAPKRPYNNAAALRKMMQEEQMKLIRVRITNLDPKKKDLPGEIFTTGNEYLGSVRKYVPYGEVTDEGYHIPFCIFKQLEARRFLNIRTIVDRVTKQTRTDSSWAKEFALEVLPPLTQAELNQLAAAQAASGE